MSIGSQMMISLEPPNAAQLLIGTMTTPGVFIFIAVSIASAISAPPAG